MVPIKRGGPQMEHQAHIQFFRGSTAFEAVFFCILQIFVYRIVILSCFLRLTAPEQVPSRPVPFCVPLRS